MSRTGLLRTLAPRVALLALGAGVAMAFYIDFCHLIYQCGCRSYWAGAAEMCNIHDATTHDCPWCSVGRWGYLPLLAIVAVQTVLAAWPRWHWALRGALILLAFPAVGAFGGLAFGLATGYWQ